MSSAFFLTAALLVLPSPAGAKPPDLPRDQDYYVTPHAHNDFADWVMTLTSSPADERCLCIDGIGFQTEPPEDGRTRDNLPWLFQLSPTPRRHFATCLLLGVHPLFLLMPTEQLLDTPADHPCPPQATTFSLPPEVFAPQHDSCPRCDGLQGSVTLNEKNFDFFRVGQCFTPVPAAAENFAPCVLSVSFRTSQEDDGTEIEKRGKDAEREIERKLSRPVSLSCSDVPLRQVIDDLRTVQGINIYLDARAFEEAGISPDDLKVTVKLDGVSFKSALALILRPYHLTYVVKDGVLQITTPPHARGMAQTKLYAVKDLLLIPGTQAKETPAAPEAQLLQLIASTVAPESWREMGGQGIIEYFPTTKTLVIHQTPDVQEQVAELLESLRRLKDRWEEDKREAETRRTAARVDGLLKACRILHETGNPAQAEKLACDAFALDADKVLDDTVVSQIYLRVRQQSKYQGCPAPAGKCAEPCGVCPAGYGRRECDQGAPILEVLQSSSQVDGKVVRALEVVEEESEVAGPNPLSYALGEAKPFRAVANSGVFEVTTAKDGPHDQEESFFDRLGDWLEMCLPDPPGHGCLEIGLDPNSLQLNLFGEYRLSGLTVHVVYRHGSLAVWATPDARADEVDK
jgi:hypothetical protein